MDNCSISFNSISRNSSMGILQKSNNGCKNPIVTMEVENFGTIKMELYPDQAPETVANFITLTNRGFYDGLTFHRVVKRFHDTRWR